MWESNRASEEACNTLYCCYTVRLNCVMLSTQSWQNKVQKVEYAGLSACKCGFVLSSADQDTSPAAKIQSPSSLPLSVSPGSPAGAWSQGLALDLPAMLNTPQAYR